MIVVDKRVHRLMHLTIIGTLQVRDAHQLKPNRLRVRCIRSLHRRLISGHAIMGQLYLIAVKIVERGHLHRLAVLHHVELLEDGRASRRQLQVQRRLVHVRLVGLPMPHQRFQFLERFSPIACRRIWHRHDSHAQHQHTQNFSQASHRSFSLQILFASLSKMDQRKSGAYRAAAPDAAVLPNRCVANPTIAPRSIPGIMMSQNNAIPARRITRRLNIAAIAIPANIPSSTEWTRFETYPVAIPATNPFNNENVITLPMTGASDGSKKPLKPSSSPSVPPTASPSTGFVRLMVSSRESARESVMHSLGILVGLHHTKEISFRVIAVRKISDAGNRSLRHHQFSTSALRRLDGRVGRLHTDRVGRCLYIRILHKTTVDPRRSLGPRGHQPILHRPRPFLNFPAEHLLIERRCAFRITRRYFKMDDSRHAFPPALRTNFLFFLMQIYRVAGVVAGAAPYFCVAYPTIKPTRLPGTMIWT